MHVVFLQFRRRFCSSTNLKGNQYAFLLRKCGKTRDLARGRALHEELTSKGFDKHTILGALLVQMYGHCGSVDEAAACYTKISNPTPFAGNVLISAYTQNGHLQKARKFFDSMPVKETVSWNAMLSAYSRNGDFQEAKRLFDAMPIKDVVSYNAMISAYTQKGHLGDAKLMFDTMKVKNVITWNAMLTAYFSKELVEEAVVLFETMTGRDNATWNGMIAGFAQCGYPQRSMALFEKMPSRDEFSWNGMIANYASHNRIFGREICGNIKCEQLLRAKELFDVMPAKFIISWNSMVQGYAQHGDLQGACKFIKKMPQTDAITWTAIATAYAQNGHLEEASVFFEKIPRKDLVASNAMISAYALSGSVDQAKLLFDSIVHPNVVSWNAMIAAYAQNGHYKEAISLFRRMDLQGVHPDRITFLTVLDACGVTAAFIIGNCVFEEIMAGNHVVDGSLTTTLVNFYGKCGRLDIARAVFDRTQPPEVALENAMLTAYANNGESLQALELAKEMLLEGVYPDEVTFIVIMSACSHAGLLRDGHSWFKSFPEDFGVLPGRDHYISMVDLLGRTGHLEDAEALVNTMPFKAEPAAWRSIAFASQSLRDYQRASRVAEKSLRSDPAYPADYVLMSKIYREEDG